ncbi:2-succinyl-5-enolpyruvyl-6-hydroxy-3-cyclohexene-1-carboxylic-acid synthase [Erwinia sp. HR93]|uniref:2-succinyl-5-enolpyruvyl-6-hydroxy-3- cyclohexene-1-carboxylic-acid synthase n=1 Tax=Erwinia sp. HR93 TaxID=3094840 RepID=UPI002ADEC4A2|nr:2-succinyl-5-enolpyruvyl-6-hydroxy-3-cyclohexene-1-carboxylic-acid synthase [Erwinia sp. HR93]MEA1065538.1 2-succinyl-5-enolpyruvyl-6-hydroxy-3-cyclohexene-1-carboxylic-acid synthase [Erwinia sp. HR93]
MSTSSFNRRWATVILEALTRHGVRHICIAPGSRSTPLTLAAAENDAFICHTHFDERGLGHLALGLAKAGDAPVAVIVTSGTAAANLYPAIIEAGLTGERLVMLTADRPPELIDCGANQAIRQQGLFASHPSQTLSLPRPAREISARWLVSTIDSALGQLSAGALHINCPFAEPLYGEMDNEDLGWQQALGDWWQGERPWLQMRSVAAALTEPDWPLWRQRRGVIVAGRLSARDGERVAAWAKALGWPLIGDVLSQTGQPLSCADLWLTHPDAVTRLSEVQIVVQFGASLTGKRLLQWQAHCQPQEYWLIDALPGRLDPAQHRGRRLTVNPDEWLQAHPADKVPRTPWAPELSALSSRAYQFVAKECVNSGEAQLAHRLPELLPEAGQLFLGNSLVVRLVDAFAKMPQGYPVWSNRGASGIDGLISTAAGVQRARPCPTLAVVGDLSALYDLNSLALLRQAPAAFVLLVINNNGGQIFSMLPTPESARERFYCMPQNVEFAHAAQMFGLHYNAAESWPELERALSTAWQRPGASVVELKVAPTAGIQTLQRLLEKVSLL